MHLKPFKFPSSFSSVRPSVRRARGDASLIILPPHLPRVLLLRLECTFHAFRHCSQRYLRLFSAGVPSFFRSSVPPSLPLVGSSLRPRLTT